MWAARFRPAMARTFCPRIHPVKGTQAIQITQRAGTDSSGRHESWPLDLRGSHLKNLVFLLRNAG